MRWKRGGITDLTIGDLGRLRNLSLDDLGRLRKLSLDDLPWVRRSNPWSMVGMFALGLAFGALAGVAVGAGPARGTVGQAAGWTRDRGRMVADRVRRPADADAERLG